MTVMDHHRGTRSVMARTPAHACARGFLHASLVAHGSFTRHCPFHHATDVWSSARRLRGPPAPGRAVPSTPARRAPPHRPPLPPPACSRPMSEPGKSLGPLGVRGGVRHRKIKNFVPPLAVGPKRFCLKILLPAMPSNAGGGGPAAGLHRPQQGVQAVQASRPAGSLLRRGAPPGPRLPPLYTLPPAPHAMRARGS